MNFKKAFTLVEMTVVMVIIAIIAMVVIRNIKHQDYTLKAQTILAQKIVRNVEEAIVRILEAEKTQCPSGKFMVKPVGYDWEFATKKTDGTTAANSTALVELFGKYLKYDSGVINFCDMSSCSSTSIKGAKLAGGGYIGIEILSSISDCAEYSLPGTDETLPAPVEFMNGSMQTKKCWGKLYINTTKVGSSSDIVTGQEEFILNLGEYGIEK